MRWGPKQRHPRQPAGPKAPGEDASELSLEGQGGIFYMKMAYGGEKEGILGRGNSTYKGVE